MHRKRFAKIAERKTNKTSTQSRINAVVNHVTPKKSNADQGICDYYENERRIREFFGE